MQFQVLGEVEATVGGRPLPFARRHERCLLGLLLLEAGQVLAVDRLVELLWEPAAQPTHPRRSVHSHVSRIRAVLNQAGATVRLATQGAGYVLHADPETIDAHRFRRLAAEGAAATDLAARAGLLAAALDLWHGPVLGADAGDPLRERVGAPLEALRLTTSEQWLAALVALERYDAALPPLARLASEHPMRERFVELQMTALYRVGRKAEALAAYERCRAWLAAELGIDPTPTLRQLHQAVLRDEVVPATGVAPVAADDEAVAVGHVPAELPADVRGFVGREVDFTALAGHVPPPGASSAAAVVAISGAAGVGKTALAVHFGHRIAARFPDGQVYLNLRGHDEGAPMRPLDAVTRLLGSLGVPAEQIPVTEEAATARYRSRLAGRRVLVVLDDAGSADQVRPLLPAAAGCLALITSRDRLTGLVASHGARRLMLATLAPDAARDLLVAVAGADRVAVEPAAAAELGRLCDHLPLALRIAAAQLVNRPHWTIEEYVAELRADRLGMLTADGDTAVRSAFGASYGRLDAASRRMFRLLGLAPGPDVTVDAAAVLADIGADAAARSLEHLARTHLVEERRPGRYTCHDLLRLHAREQAEAEESAAARAAARERLGAWYLSHAVQAVQCLQPQVSRLPATEAWAAWATADLTAPETAVAWLDAECANLAATVDQLAEAGPRPWAWLLADALRGYFLVRTAVEWLPTAAAGLRAATAEGDLAGQAAMQLSVADAHRRRSQFDIAVAAYDTVAELSRRAGWLEGEYAARTNLGTAYLERGAPRHAEPHLRESLVVRDRLGDGRGVATALANLGVLCLDVGKVAEAEDLLRRAVAQRRQWGSPAASALNNLSTVCRYRGRFDEARAHAAEALAEYRASGFLLGESIVLDTTARIRRDAGDLTGADDAAHAALDCARRCNTPRMEADAHNTIGSVYACRGRHREAIAAHQEALRLAGAAQARFVEIESWAGLGAAYLAAGEHPSALTCARQGLDLARDAGYRIWEAEVLTTLAQAHEARGERARAVAHAREALAICRETGYQLGVARLLATVGE